ncbi:MAG: NAD(P)/FAD-dependent oxidoreductase [Chloroflexi bacterium]|nr:NAD(P)/FAD-dependent oxidoreductase [Chloroflexota bacterium]
MAEETVLVIGAGPAGLACAYYLEQANITYRVVDQADVVGSTWASLYPSLRLNTTRFYSHLPGRRFPLSYGIFPTGRQYHRYLVEYARAHNFNIHLAVTVYCARPERGGWWVETSEGAAWYPALISATGRFCSPYTPPIPGMRSFRGRLLHAHDYLGPEPFADQRVMVVGNGPSGVDIATELGAWADPPVLLAQRTGVVLRPRYPWGLPKHVWMMICDALPERLARPLDRKIADLKFEDLDALGIKTPQNETDSTAAGGTRGRELIEAVRAGRVRSVECPVRFHEDCVELADGSCAVVDAVIVATGYRPALFRYLDLGPVETNKDGWPLRVDEPPGDVSAGRRQVKGFPGLYLVGVFYQGKGAMYNFNTEAAAAVEEIQAHLATRRENGSAE